jgi:hypothetical protein
MARSTAQPGSTDAPRAGPALEFAVLLLATAVPNALFLVRGLGALLAG